MLNVVCFYWSGKDRPGWNDRNLGARYVNALHRGVQRNLSIPHRFICFSDNGLKVDKGVEVQNFDSPSWKGCFPKLYAFHPENGLSDRVVVMDLDLVVCGSLDDMFSYDGDFMTRMAFRNRLTGKSGGDLVFFRHGTYTNLWHLLHEKFIILEQEERGRERNVYRKYVGKMDFVQPLYPNQVLSYRRHVRLGQWHDNCRIVSFHGKPRPHELKTEPLVKEHWS